MKKILYLASYPASLLLLLTPFITFSQGITPIKPITKYVVMPPPAGPLDEKNGFKVFILGSSYESLKRYLNMQAFSSDPATKTVAYMVVNPENYKVGTAQIDAIICTFFDKQLFDILIFTKGLTNSRTILRTLTEAFGEGKQENEYIEKYLWQGSRVILEYNENGVTNDAKISFTSVPLLLLRDECVKSATKKAADEL